MIVTDNDNPDVKTAKRLVPTININWTGREILNLNVGLNGEITNGSQSLGNEKIGEAYIQIVNQAWVSEPLLDFINSKLTGFPRELRYLQPLPLMSYSDRIKNQYGCLDDALTCMDFGHSEIKGTIAVIHFIHIYPSFRKKGLSKPYLWLILKALKENMNVEYVLLQACPMEINRGDKKAYEKEKIRLEKIYLKSGFNKRSKGIKAKDGFKISYMFQNISSRSFDTYSV